MNANPSFDDARIRLVVGGRGAAEESRACPADWPELLGPFVIDANLSSRPNEVTAAFACAELGREIGRAAPRRPYWQSKVTLGGLKRTGLAHWPGCRRHLLPAELYRGEPPRRHVGRRG
jgi:hypothetical protein